MTVPRPPTGDPGLLGRRVVLRDVRDSDIDALHGIVGDDRVTRWLSFDSRTREQTATMIAAARRSAVQTPRTEYYLAVAPREDVSVVVGLARLGIGGVRAAKLGFAVRHDQQRRGIAAEVVAVMVRFAFTTLELHRVTGAAAPDNLASHRVLERAGFQREGRLRDHVFTNGSWRDSILYSRLATDPDPDSADGRGPNR